MAYRKLRKGNVGRRQELFIDVDKKPSDVTIRYWMKRCESFGYKKFVLIWKESDKLWRGEEYSVYDSW